MGVILQDSSKLSLSPPRINSKAQRLHYVPSRLLIYVCTPIKFSCVACLFLALTYHKSILQRTCT